MLETLDRGRCTAHAGYCTCLSSSCCPGKRASACVRAAASSLATTHLRQASAFTHTHTNTTHTSWPRCKCSNCCPVLMRTESIGNAYARSFVSYPWLTAKSVPRSNARLLHRARSVPAAHLSMRSLAVPGGAEDPSPCSTT